MLFINIKDKATLEQLLMKLQVWQKPIFGQMTSQHMIEHLSLLVFISRGEKSYPQVTPDDKLPLYLAFLTSDKPLPVNYKAPFIEGLPPLQFPDLEAAKGDLFNELKAFKEYYSQKQEIKHVHPVFGPLNKHQWELFHNKHFSHHFRQFSLI